MITPTGNRVVRFPKFEQKIIEYTNDYRKEQNLPAFRQSEKLNDVNADFWVRSAKYDKEVIVDDRMTKMGYSSFEQVDNVYSFPQQINPVRTALKEFVRDAEMIKNMKSKSKYMAVSVFRVGSFYIVSQCFYTAFSPDKKEIEISNTLPRKEINRNSNNERIKILQ